MKLVHCMFIRNSGYKEHFVIVPLNLTCLYCLQHFFCELFFHLYKLNLLCYLSSLEMSTPYDGGAVRLALMRGPKLRRMIFRDSHAVSTYLGIADVKIYYPKCLHNIPTLTKRLIRLMCSFLTVLHYFSF